MSGYALSNFLIYVLLNTFTPGPGNILALNTATNYGWRKGRPLYLGIFSGYLLIQTLAVCFVLGLGSVLQRVALPEIRRRGLHPMARHGISQAAIPKSRRRGRNGRPFPWDSCRNW